ncbi:hypothetical protein [Tellurirhabdus bombi]|uniref:hypothetical protein n=1 Tax=Tellurirhabdus bombi TaxID=2907205 RepID=UPI001F345DFD|nr:hypothetical protein [Tellurirhabdus bombi]
MKKRYKYKFLHRLLCWLMAIHVINISIDAPDNYLPPTLQSGLQKDLSVNEIESLGELILEDWFGITDAFPEHDNSNKESHLTQVESDYIFSQPFVFTVVPISWHLVTNPATFSLIRVLTHIEEITPPPPKA